MKNVVFTLGVGLLMVVILSVTPSVGYCAPPEMSVSKIVPLTPMVQAVEYQRFLNVDCPGYPVVPKIGTVASSISSFSLRGEVLRIKFSGTAKYYH